jgi:putative ABC transport system permease protein
MKYWPLIWRNLLRRKVRTTFTLLSVFVAFLLFGLLMTIRTAFTFGVDIAGADRLVTMDKVSIIRFLPVAYVQQIAALPGVTMVTHASWFGGVYQDPKNFFAQWAVDQNSYFKVHDEFHVPPDQLQAWLADRQGVIVGVDTAKRFGWKIGDRVPLGATIFQPVSGGQTWDFNISGLYDGDSGVDKTNFFFRYDYFDENRRPGIRGNVSWIYAKIADPAHAADMASRIDATFANSANETKTATEKVIFQSFAQQMGDIGSILVAVLSAVLFTILLVSANTMAQAVRERTSEIAVLKTLGFSGPLVLTLVLTESILLAAVGGAIGLGLAWLVVQGGDPTHGMLPIFILRPRYLVAGGALILALGVLSGAVPAVGAMRLRITDALRRN